MQAKDLSLFLCISISCIRDYQRLPSHPETEGPSTCFRASAPMAKVSRLAIAFFSHFPKASITLSALL